jgi:hypothetical protein
MLDGPGATVAESSRPVWRAPAAEVAAETLYLLGLLCVETLRLQTLSLPGGRPRLIPQSMLQQILLLALALLELSLLHSLAGAKRLKGLYFLRPLPMTRYTP